MQKTASIILQSAVITAWSLVPLAAQTSPAVAEVPAPTLAPMMVIPVDSQAFVFSPGNWTGDDGRGGKAFRQTWNSGAYLRVSWTSENRKPSAKITLDTATYDLKGSLIN